LGDKHPLFTYSALRGYVISSAERWEDWVEKGVACSLPAAEQPVSRDTLLNLYTHYTRLYRVVKGQFGNLTICIRIVIFGPGPESDKKGLITLVI